MNSLLNLLQLFAATIKDLFVAKEDGKGLSSNDLTNELKTKYDAAHTHSQSSHAPVDAQTASQVSSSITSALTSYSTTTAMNTAIANAVGSAGHLKRLIVASLPAVGSADTEIIYMKQKDSGKNDNLYDEYMVISGKWEKIGDTEVDLTGYLKESDITEITQAEVDALFA